MNKKADIGLKELINLVRLMVFIVIFLFIIFPFVREYLGQKDKNAENQLERIIAEINTLDDDAGIEVFFNVNEEEDNYILKSFSTCSSGETPDRDSCLVGKPQLCLLYKEKNTKVCGDAVVENGNFKKTEELLHILGKGNIKITKEKGIITIDQVPLTS